MSLNLKIKVMSKNNPQGKLVRPELLRRTIYNRVEKLFRDSIRACIEELVNHIHIDTGMSVATLLPLAVQVQFSEIVLSAMAQAKNATKPGFYNLTGKWADNNAAYKCKELGIMLGNDAFTYKTGAYTNPTFTFDFKIRAFQYYLNEYGLSYQSNAPWNSLESGHKAAINYFHEHFKEYTDPSSIAKYLVTADEACLITGGVNQ